MAGLLLRDFSYQIALELRDSKMIYLEGIQFLKFISLFLTVVLL